MYCRLLGKTGSENKQGRLPGKQPSPLAIGRAVWHDRSQSNRVCEAYVHFFSLEPASALRIEPTYGFPWVPPCHAAFLHFGGFPCTNPELLNLEVLSPR